MKFVQITGEYFHKLRRVWLKVAVTVPSHVVYLCFEENIYWARTTHPIVVDYKLTHKEWDRLNHILLNEPPDTLEEIVKRTVDNAIKELEVEKGD